MAPDGNPHPEGDADLWAAIMSESTISPVLRPSKDRDERQGVHGLASPDVGGGMMDQVVQRAAERLHRGLQQVGWQAGPAAFGQDQADEGEGIVTRMRTPVPSRRATAARMGLKCQAWVERAADTAGPRGQRIRTAIP